MVSENAGILWPQLFYYHLFSCDLASSFSSQESSDLGQRSQQHFFLTLLLFLTVYKVNCGCFDIMMIWMSFFVLLLTHTEMGVKSELSGV